MMSKILKITFLLAVLLILSSEPVLAQDTSGGQSSGAGTAGGAAVEVVDLAEEIDLSKVKDMLNQLDQDVRETIPHFSLAKIFEDLREGRFSFKAEDLGSSIFKAILKEIVVNGPLMAKLLILAIICAVINQLQRAFDGGAGKIAQMLVYLVLLGLALTTFKIALDVGSEAIDRMVSFMQIALPAMYTILVAMGNLTSAALFKPIVLGSIVFLASLMKNIVLPLFFLGIVLRLFNGISEQFKLSKLAAFLEFAGKLSIGVVMTVFIGIMSIQGVAGGVADGVTLRTLKYSADLIPVVGKFFKDAVELVVGSGLLLKNALGLVSLLAIIVITLAPVIKIIAMMLTFKISAALIEPLGGGMLADSLQDMSKGLFCVFTVVASVGLMFFIAVTIIIGAGNLAVMLR